MAEDKKILLEVRGMKWNEHCRYTDEVLSEINKTEETELKKDRIAAEWIFKNIYPAADINDFSYGEVIAIMASTVAMTTEVRKSEIKNLKISSLGNGSVENIAKIAEESTKPSK